MKKKELKKLALRIMELESIVESSSNEKEIQNAQNEILSISGHLKPEDMFEIDEIIQNFYAK